MIVVDFPQPCGAQISTWLLEASRVARSLLIQAKSNLIDCGATISMRVSSRKQARESWSCTAALYRRITQSSGSGSPSSRLLDSIQSKIWFGVAPMLRPEASKPCYQHTSIRSRLPSQNEDGLRSAALL